MSQITATNYAAIAEETVQKYLKTVPEMVRNSQFGEVLSANTERIQGSLVLAGYELEGGTDTPMILRAALATELFHAYVQCMDQGIDTDQALRAAHEAEIILANLETDAENRLKAVSITNRTLMLAVSARNPQVSTKDVTYWRATELALNPLHVGQVLAGADCTRTNAVTQAALAYGRKLLEGHEPDFGKFVALLEK